MDTDRKNPPTEESDGGFPIDIYTEERIAEFLAEDELTPEQKKRINEMLTQSNAQK